MIADAACTWPRTCNGCEKLDSILENKERACAACRSFGPDADMVPICGRYLKTTLPCEVCGEWERRTRWN